MPSEPYNPRDSYWLPQNKGGQVFGSARGGYVTVEDGDYVAWLARGRQPTPILCDGELADVLLKPGLPPAVVTAAGAQSWGNLDPADIAALTALGLAAPHGE